LNQEEDVSETYDLFQEGKRHLRRGNAEQASRALERAKEHEPRKASIREALGIAYFRSRRWQDAEAEFRALVELAPADHYGHYGLGRSLEKQGRTEEAAGHLKLAGLLRPSDEPLT
jgi:Flp pilus assembly protein TadD